MRYMRGWGLHACSFVIVIHAIPCRLILVAEKRRFRLTFVLGIGCQTEVKLSLITGTEPESSCTLHTTRKAPV